MAALREKLEKAVDFAINREGEDECNFNPCMTPMVLAFIFTVCSTTSDVILLGRQIGIKLLPNKYGFDYIVLSVCCSTYQIGLGNLMEDENGCIFCTHHFAVDCRNSNLNVIFFFEMMELSIFTKIAGPFTKIAGENPSSTDDGR